MRVIIESIASEQAIGEACSAGKDWAMDSSMPTSANLVQLDEIPVLDEEDDYEDAPIMNSTNIPHSPPPKPDNHWLPNSYTEAMTQPDLWQGPI